MPNKSDLSDFVVPNEDVKDGEKIKFIDGGNLHTYEEEGRTVIQFRVLCPNGKEKKLSMNRTSANNLAPLYGSDTEGWEGKEALVTIVKMNVRGQLKSVIYLYPVKE
jgi:hypothetical protein